MVVFIIKQLNVATDENTFLLIYYIQSFVNNEY